MSFNPGGGGVAAADDVALSNPTNDHALVYDGTTQKWKNAGLTKNQVGLSNVDNTSDSNKPISSAVQAALDTKQAAGDYPTVEQISQQITDETSGMATLSDITTATQYHKRIFILQNSTAPNPVEAQSGDLVFVPDEALLPIVRSFTGSGLSAGHIIRPLTDGTPTLAPDGFQYVSNGPQWNGSDIVIPNVSTTTHVRWTGFAQPTDWAVGMEFRFGQTGDTFAPESGAPWFYGNTTSNIHFRLTLSGSGQVQFRNSAGTTLGTSATLIPGRSYFVTAYGTTGTDMVHLRIRDLSNGSVFFTQDSAVGTTSSLDGIYFGRQSASLEYFLPLYMRRLVVSSVAQELYQW